MTEKDEKIRKLEERLQEAEARLTAAEGEIELNKLDQEGKAAQQQDNTAKQKDKSWHLLGHKHKDEGRAPPDYSVEPQSESDGMGISQPLPRDHMQYRYKSPLVPPQFAADLRYVVKKAKEQACICSPLGLVATVLTAGLFQLFWMLAVWIKESIQRERPGPDAEPVPWNVLCEELHPPGLPGHITVNDLRIDPYLYEGPVYEGTVPYMGPGLKGIRITQDDLDQYYGWPIESESSGPSWTVIMSGVPRKATRIGKWKC